MEIKQQEFKRGMRGYDTVEVDTFLEMVGNEFEKLLQDVREYDKKIIALESELAKFKEVESTLKQTLMNVQETSDKSLENSKKEAILMRKEAEVEVQRMVEEARRERDAMKEEVITLQTQKQSLITRLRHVLTSQLELMDVLEIDDADLSQLKDRTKKVFSAAKGEDKMKSNEVVEPTSVTQEVDPETPKAQENMDSEKASDPETNARKKEDGTNLFRDVFGDDMENFIK
jgi:cell division initiation protein